MSVLLAFKRNGAGVGGGSGGGGGTCGRFFA